MTVRLYIADVMSAGALLSIIDMKACSAVLPHFAEPMLRVLTLAQLSLHITSLLVPSSREPLAQQNIARVISVL